MLTRTVAVAVLLALGACKSGDSTSSSAKSAPARSPEKAEKDAIVDMLLEE